MLRLAPHTVRTSRRPLFSTVALTVALTLSLAGIVSVPAIGDPVPTDELLRSVGAQDALSGAKPAGSVEADSIEVAERAERLLDHLRRQDQVLERWARQLTHPEGVGPDRETLRHFIEGLIHIGADVHQLEETHPDLASKHGALVRRAREVSDSLSIEKSARADLAPLAESVRWLEVPDAARLKSGKLDTLTKPTCDAAAMLGLGEKRAVPKLDRDTEILVRFVPEKDGFYRVDTADSRTDTRLALLDGCSGKVLRSADDEVSLRARLEFEGTKDVPAWIRVGSDREGAVLVEAELLAEKGAGTASISGTVTARSTGLPVEGVTLRLFRNGGLQQYGTTDINGNFTFEHLIAGTHVVSTSVNTDVWLNQAWREISCGLADCGWTVGDSIELVEGQTVEDIDFRLDAPGAISGRVTDAQSGEGVSQVNMTLYLEDGTWADSRTTDTLGRYRFDPLNHWTYVLSADAPRHYDQVYDGIACNPGCTVTDGTPIVVGAGETLTGLDLALDRISSIEVTVKEILTGQPVSDGWVTLYDSTSLEAVGSGSLNFQGQAFFAIEPGTYLAVLRSNLFESQMYSFVSCTSECDLSLATPLAVEVNEAVSIQFHVAERSSIQGFVGSTDGLPFTSTLYVSAYDSEGLWVDDVVPDPYGTYRVRGLDEGSFRVLASSYGFQSEWFDNVPCVPVNSCESLAGHEIWVPSNSEVGDVNFLLERFGSISGRVTGIDGVTPLGPVSISAYAVGTNWSSTATSDPLGRYLLKSVPPGPHVIRTRSLEAVDEMYDDIPCETECDEGTGVQVSAPLNTHVSGIDFLLQRKAWISGVVTDAATGLGLDRAQVAVYDQSGAYERSSTTNVFGEYKISGLDDGTYFVGVYGVQGYVGETHDGVRCSDYEWAKCDPTSGTPVSVSVESGATVDLEMEPGGRIVGRVMDPAGRSVSARIYLFNSEGEVIHNDYGAYLDFQGLTSGSYYLMTAESGHQDELWPDTPCLGESVPACSLLEENSISVTLGVTSSEINFVLEPLGKISGTLVDLETREIIGTCSYVELYDPEGESVRNGYGNPFVIPNVLPGTYYLRAARCPNYLAQVFGGETCTPFCDPTSGLPITIEIADTVENIEIPMTMGPGFRGRVVDGGTGRPVGGVAIDRWTLGGTQLPGTVTDSQGWYLLPIPYLTHRQEFFLSTHNTAGHTDLIHSGVECPDGSAYQGLCDPTQGTPLTVQPDTHLRRIDFIFDDQITIFTNGFESGDLTSWSSAVGD